MAERKEAVRAERPETALDEMSSRIAEILNGLAAKLPIEPRDVDLRIVAELCWALDLHPSIDIIPIDQGSGK